MNIERNASARGEAKPVKKKPAVLFVCTANVCRSPMAAALFRAQLRKVRPDWQDWIVDSAGTWADDGEPASRNSVQVMGQRGLDISDHRSRTVNESMLRKYDLILTMGPGHKEALQVEFPTIANRVYLLSEMDGTMNPISDPYGGPVEAYEETAIKMEKLLLKGMKQIITLVIGRA